MSRADLRKAEHNVARLNRELDIEEAFSSESPESSESEKSSSEYGKQARRSSG